MKCLTVNKRGFQIVYTRVAPVGGTREEDSIQNKEETKRVHQRVNEERLVSPRAENCARESRVHEEETSRVETSESTGESKREEGGLECPPEDTRAPDGSTSLSS